MSDDKDTCEAAGAFEKCLGCALFRKLSEEKQAEGHITGQGVCRVEGDAVVNESPIDETEEKQ